MPSNPERDRFRATVFTRDHGRCVLCGAVGVDAHHILERRLWDDGGYHLDNGATVCAACHLRCEQTLVDPASLRQAAGIVKSRLPEHLYRDQDYDKWGNPVLANGQRLAGELFHDASVQKALAAGGVLALFTPYVKYPRTYHLPWSDGLSDDDRMMRNLDQWAGKRVVVTEKMDGENTTIYRNYFHARSVDGHSHPSRGRAKAIAAEFQEAIPDGWRICAENLTARHSIPYQNLTSYLQGFSVWDAGNRCLSWDDTAEWLALLGLPSVKMLYDGLYDERTIRRLYDPYADRDRSEGYVVRSAQSFGYGEFRQHVGKYVRANHVTSDRHWMHGRAMVANGLAPVDDQQRSPDRCQTRKPVRLIFASQ